MLFSLPVRSRVIDISFMSLRVSSSSLMTILLIVNSNGNFCLAGAVIFPVLQNYSPTLLGISSLQLALVTHMSLSPCFLLLRHLDFSTDVLSSIAFLFPSSVLPPVYRSFFIFRVPSPFPLFFVRTVENATHPPLTGDMGKSDPHQQRTKSEPKKIFLPLAIPPYN